MSAAFAPSPQALPVASSKATVATAASAGTASTRKPEGQKSEGPSFSDALRSADEARAGTTRAMNNPDRARPGLQRRLDAHDLPSPTDNQDVVDTGSKPSGPDEPQINPGPGTDVAKGSLEPQINPGPGTEVDAAKGSDVPQILPVGFGPTQPKPPEGPQINPGPGGETADAKLKPQILAPQVLPGSAGPDTVARSPNEVGQPGPDTKAKILSAPVVPAPALDEVVAKAAAADAMTGKGQAAAADQPQIMALAPTDQPRRLAAAARSEATPSNASATRAGEGETDDATATPATTPASTTPAAATAASPATSPGVAQARIEALLAASGQVTSESAEEARSGPLPGGDPAQSATQGTTATAHDRVTPQISQTALDATAQIAAQIIRKLEGRATRFEMALTPDELGRVDVKLDIDADGKLAARLAFDNPAAALDLKGRVDELRRQLIEAGFQLATDAFEFAERDSQSSAFDRGQGQSDTSRRAFAQAGRIATEADAPVARWVSLSLNPDRVDVRI